VRGNQALAPKKVAGIFKKKEDEVERTCLAALFCRKKKEVQISSGNKKECVMNSTHGDVNPFEEGGRKEKMCGYVDTHGQLSQR